MEEIRFDNLTKRLARGSTSRRRLLRALAGVTLGGALGRAGAAVAAPQCREEGHPCEGNQVCCDQLVCTAGGPGAALRCTPCPSGTVFAGGTCVPPGTCPGATDACTTRLPNCGPNNDCFCTTTPSGDSACTHTFTMDHCHPCVSDNECYGSGLGHFCVKALCCDGETACVPPC